MRNNFSYSGFTLVETLVAVAIIMLAITGPFMSAERTVVVASIVRDKMTASFLAQEGLEYTRALRDKVYLEECYKDSAACSYWWGDYSSKPYQDTRYDIQQCSVSTPCSVDTSMNKSTYSTPYITPFNTLNTTELHVCLSNSQTCGALYLNKATGQYTTTASSNTVPTRFIRTIYAQTFAGSPDTEIISTVKWTNHGRVYSSSVSDRLTSWY